MRKLFAVLVLLSLMSCGNASDEELARQAAKEAAERYYDYLLDGRYDQFLNGRFGMDSIPDNYREQLLAGYEQFMAQQQEQHGGIRSFKVNNASMDSTLQLMQVFVVLNYGDDTQEEIVLPMVERNGEWKMR